MSILRLLDLPDIWFYPFKLYERYFSECRTRSSIKSGQILPLFKRKGTKSSNKDNYRGITVFPTLCKVYELILLRRLERFANENSFFLIFGSASKRVLVVLRPHSPSWKLLIIILNVEAKFRRFS